MLEKCLLTVLELIWNQRLRHKKTKLSMCHVHTTAKQVISRPSRRKNENVFKMSKDEKCTCKACKNSVFNCQICKFVGFLLPSSSWLLKLRIFFNGAPTSHLEAPFVNREDIECAQERILKKYARLLKLLFSLEIYSYVDFVAAYALYLESIDGT